MLRLKLNSIKTNIITLANLEYKLKKLEENKKEYSKLSYHILLI